MNKSDLVSAIAESADISKQSANNALNAFMDTVSATLAKGDDVTLVGFGTFSVKSRPARTGRNPQTGEELQIAASKAPNFKAGKSLKDQVNA